MAQARTPGQSSTSVCTTPRAQRPCFGAACHPAPGPNDAPPRARSGRTKQARSHGPLPGAGAEAAAYGSGRPPPEPRHTGRPQGEASATHPLGCCEEARHGDASSQGSRSSPATASLPQNGARAASSPRRPSSSPTGARSAGEGRRTETRQLSPQRLRTPSS